MQKRTMNHSMSDQWLDGARGVGMLEVLIVMAIIAIVCVFAFMRIATAQRSVQLANAEREFAGYLERTRVDSIRRRATAPANMAGVTINQTDRYSVTADFDGNGVTETRLILLPQGVAFNLTPPVAIAFNWRGRATVTNMTGAGISIGMTNGADAPLSTYLTRTGDVMKAGQGDYAPDNADLSVNDSSITPTTGINTRTIIP